MPPSRALRADSSRTSPEAAGWANPGPAVGEQIERSRRKTFPRRFNWLLPRVLLESRNDRLANLVRKADTDIVNDERMRWVASQRAAGVDTEFLLQRPAGVGRTFSFLAIGDPGEGDESQYVVVRHLLDHRDTQFAIVVSDVIYPTGEANDYADCFYRAYQEYPRPIFALPGNHDWYSLLTGFMWNFCGAESLPAPTDRLSSYSWQERLARFLWLRPRAPQRALLMAYRDRRWRAGRADASEPWQRGPYFALETPELLILGIDTGTSGRLDREQAAWLLRMARRPQRKILFTGKPLRVNGRRYSCGIDWLPILRAPGTPDTGDPRPVQTGDEPAPDPRFPDVASIVEHDDFHFIAAIGGDVHNYQRYPVDGVQYVVAGGSGAFMSPTHTIARVESSAAGVGEEDFRCYPLRGDSLARIARGSARRLRWAVLWLAVIALGLLWCAAASEPDSNVFPAGQRDWKPALDYDRWATIGIGALCFAVGLGLVVLPWFHVRVRIVLGLVAAGAGLLAWQGAFDFVPGGTALFAAAGVVGAVSIPVLSRERARRIPGYFRLAIAVALAGLALLALSILGSHWLEHFAIALLALAALAVLLVGGPRLDRKRSRQAGVAVAGVALLLLVIVEGWSWIVLALLAGVAVYAALRGAIELRWILVKGGEVDADKAAAYMAGLISAEATRGDVPVDRATRGKLRALFAGHGKRSYLYLGGETAYSALFDSNDQPFFKSFLRIDVEGESVKILCFGVAGENEDATVEDHVRWNGARWTDARAILGSPAGAVVGEVDWYDEPKLGLHLDEQQSGKRFSVELFDQQWQEVGELDYADAGQAWEPAWPGGRPRRIRLREAGVGTEATVFATGDFV